MTKESHPSRAWRFLRWPAFIALGVVLFFVISISTARETYRAWQVDQQIQGLQSQVDQLESKKMHLVDTIQRLSSDDELDKQARTQLGLRKPGERVIILPEANGHAGGNQDSQGQVSSSSSESTPSNPQKWFHYFFPG